MALPITIIEKENLLKSFPMERLQQEMSQPTGNFPLYLVMSRIKELESIMASHQADAAERQMSNQAGSVYERMLQGQQDTGMGLNAGMPNVMSEVAATPDASMQGMTPPALAEGLKSVAAHGGYVNNLPTVRMAGKDESRTSRSREAMNWMKRETPGQGVVPDPFLNFEALGLGSGLAALGGGTLFNMLRKRGQSAKDFMPRETADMQEEQRQVKDLKRERDLDEVRETGWMYAPHRLLDRLRGGDTVEQPSPEFSSVSDLNESQYATFIKAFPDWRTIFGGRPQERNAQQEHLLHNTITAVRSNKNWTSEELREMARVGAAPDTSGMEEGLGYIPETGKLLEVREKSQGGMAGLPTVRMRGGDPRDYMPTTDRDTVRVAAAAQKAGMPTGGSFEENTPMGGYNPHKQGLSALVAAKARRARELAALGMPLVGPYGPTSPYGTGAGFVKSYGETAVASNGGYAGDLPTVRMQGMEHYPPGPDYSWVPGAWDAIKGAYTNVLDFTGQRTPATDPDDYDEYGRPIRVDSGDPDVVAVPDGERHVPKTELRYTVPPDQDADNLIARQVGGLEQNFSIPVQGGYSPENIGVTKGAPISIDEFTGTEAAPPPPPAPVVIAESDRSAIEPPPPSEEAMREELYQKTLASLHGDQPVADVDAGYITLEQLQARGKERAAESRKERKEFTDSNTQFWDDFQDRADARAEIIKTGMTEYKDFKAGGPLPEALRKSFINELLIGAGFALQSPTMHEAASKFFAYAADKKKEIRDDFADALATSLTHTSELQRLEQQTDTAVQGGRAALAQANFEYEQGMIKEAGEYERWAVEQNQVVRTNKIAMEQIKVQRMTAHASMLNALAPEGSPDALLLLNDQAKRLWNNPETRDDPQYFPPGATGPEDLNPEMSWSLINEILEASKIYPSGTVPTAQRTEDTGWDTAMTDASALAATLGRTAGYDSTNAKLVSTIVRLQEDPYNYTFGELPSPEELAAVPPEAFIMAYFEANHPQQIKEGGQWDPQWKDRFRDVAGLRQ